MRAIVVTLFFCGPGVILYPALQLNAAHVKGLSLMGFGLMIASMIVDSIERRSWYYQASGTAWIASIYLAGLAGFLCLTWGYTTSKSIEVRVDRLLTVSTPSNVCPTGLLTPVTRKDSAPS